MFFGVFLAFFVRFLCFAVMKCELCGNVFISAAACSAHIRESHRSERFACFVQDCPARFSSKRSRDTHMHGKHSKRVQLLSAEPSERAASPPFIDVADDESADDVGQQVSDLMQLRYKFGLSEAGINAVRSLISSHLDAQAAHVSAAVADEDVRHLVGSAAEQYRSSVAALDLAACKQWLMTRAGSNVVPHPAGGYMVPLRVALSGFVRRHPDAYAEAMTNTNSEIDGVADMTTGTMYRNHPVLSLGHHLALSLCFDFAVTTANQLGVAAKKRRNFGILVAVVCNVPSVAMKDSSLLLLAVVPKASFGTYNALVEPFVAELEELLHSTCWF